MNQKISNIPKPVIVIPCYNEAERLSWTAIEELLNEGVSILFVNDGSTDLTLDSLHALKNKHHEHIDILSLPQNQGKGEAVRQGMLHALCFDAPIIGYADADMATPPKEIGRLIHILSEADRDVVAVIGSRIRFLGTAIHRHATRHYVGRVFATIASLILGVAIYDSQCGAKFFRRSKILHEILQKPLGSRWIFDIELIGRLLKKTGCNAATADRYIIEVPLKIWRDVNGSKIRLKDYPTIVSGLIIFWWTFRIRRTALWL